MTQHRIVFLDRDSLPTPLKAFGFDHTYAEYGATAPADVVPRLADASIAIINKVPLREDALAQLPNLRMVAVAATGVDCIDIAACRTRGIAVANIRNYAVHTVPEHVFALMLALRRNLFAYRQDVEAGLWQQAGQFCLFTHSIGDLHGATLGIVGAGTLGRATAALGRAFGMRVVYAQHRTAPADGGMQLPFAQLLAEADVISLHCPLNDATRNLFGAAQFQQMKRGAILINTARAGLVDTEALIAALDSGHLGGAGIDVLPVEPPHDGHPLLDLQRVNLIVTPHVAWASRGAMQGLADQLVDNIAAWVSGRPRHLVT